MSSGHVIDECRVELTFRHEQDALAGQAIWESFVRERLLAVAEAVFDEISEPGEICRLDSVSIDLGGADPRTAGREIERRMREQLHAAMAGMAGQTARGARLRAPAGGRVLTRAASDLDQLQQFLQSGLLPWHSQHRARAAFDALIRRVLETNAAAFAQWLREAVRSPSVFPRLVRQFPEDVLEAVGTLLLPRHAVFLSALARQLTLLFSGTGGGSDPAYSLNRMIWDALLGAVLERGSATPDAAKLARQALKRLARLSGGSNAGTAAALRKAIAHLRSTAEPEFDVGGAWHALRRATALDDSDMRAADAALRRMDGAATDPVPSSRPTEAGTWRHLAHALERAVMRGDPLAVRGVWHILLSQHAAMVIGVVRRRGVLAKVRRRMAEGLPEAMLQDIVRLLEPLHSDFIAEFVHRPDLFQVAMGEQALESTALRRRTWEFTLTYLLVERGSSFNKEAYLGSVVRQMAARDNLGYRQLLDALVGVLEDVETGGILRIQMLDMLRRLEQQAEAVENDGRSEPLSGVDMVQGTLAYDETAAALLRGRRVAPEQADAAGARLEALASVHTWQFLRLVRELETNLPLAVRIAGGLPVAVLRRLVYAVMALEHPHGDAAAFLVFRTTLDRYTLQARNPQSYLAQVLSALLARQWVDLEALAHSPEMNAPLLEAAPRSNEDGMKAAARRHLQVRLEEWIGGGPADGVAPAWNELVRDHPQLLRSVLRRRGRSEHARREMAHRATESMLRDMVHVLEPAHGDFIDDIMRQPEWLRVETALPAANTEQGKRRLWVFTLGYLLVDRGGQFNKKAYLGSLARQIAAHDNLRAADFVHALVRQLAAVAAPKARQLEMIALLRMIAVEMGAPSAVAGTPATLPAEMQVAAGTSAMRAKTSQARLKVLLHDWIDGGPVDALAPVWKDVVRGHPALLQAVLRSRGRSERASREMAHRATESMLRDMVRVLEPVQGDFIDEIVNHPERFRGAAAMPGTDTGQGRRRLWSFTLGYLLADRGGQFNRKSYLASLIRRTAAHDNLPVADLLRTLFETFGNKDVAVALRVEMLDLLRALAAESGYVLPGEAHTEEDTLEAVLRGSGSIAGERRKRLNQIVERRLASAPAALRGCLADALQEPRAIRRLVAVLSESLLTRVLALLCPSDHTRALRYADIIATTWLLSCSSNESPQVGQTPEHRAVAHRPGRAAGPVSPKITRWKWQCVFRYLIVEGRTFDDARFARYCLADLRSRGAGEDMARLRARLLPHLARSGIAADRERMEVIAGALSALATDGGQPDPRPAAVPRPPALRRAQDAVAPSESLHVTNAGQVLAAPYMPQLFTMLQLTADGKFISERAAHRAIHLLQFMVDGSTDTPEHLLTLNKILCGVPIDTTVARDVFLTDHERQTVDGMIRGMIQNWSAIGSTSVAGFRESFLQREGRLKLKDGNWHLLVEPRAFDMLLDRIPWGYATIKHAWMHHIVHVDWR